MRVEAIPVVRGARTLGVITMHTHAIAQRTPSRLELTYRHLADALARMIAHGEFPRRRRRPACVGELPGWATGSSCSMSTAA